jgi:hypothetical protein
MAPPLKILGYARNSYREAQVDLRDVLDHLTVSLARMAGSQALKQ